MNKDAIIYTYLLSHFMCRFKKINIRESILLDQKHVLLIGNGTLMEESEEKKGIVRCCFSNSFQFSTESPMVLKALEATEVCLLKADQVFKKLEEEKILSNFFLQIAEGTEKNLKRQAILGEGNPRNKIVETLNFLLENNMMDSSKAVFPKWLRINVLAKLANCSITTTSATLNELSNKGILDIKTSPWEIKGEFSRLTYFEKSPKKLQI